MSNQFYSLREKTSASDLARRQTNSRTPGTHGPRRNPIVTPSPRTSNPYSPLETETDDDESNRSNNNNSNASEISAASSDDFDFQDDFFNTTMSSNIPIETVYEGLSAEDRKSIREPTLNDVQRVRSSIANNLYNQTSQEELTGHSSIVESLEGHRLRMEDNSVSLPAVPKKPSVRPPVKADKGQLLTWELDRRQYNNYMLWDKAVIHALLIIFPNGMTDIERGHTGMLPMTLTGRSAMDHIEDKTKTDVVATKAYVGLLDDMRAMKYEPNSNGPVQYFKDLKTAQYEANALDKHGKISDGQIIMCAKDAFTSCGLEPTHTTTISKAWVTADDDNESNHPGTHLATRWLRFTLFYNRELKVLHSNGDTGNSHQANHTSVLTSRVDDLERGLIQSESNIEQIYSNQEAIESRPNHDGASIPGAISTSGGSAFGTGESLAKTMHSMLTEIKDLKSAVKRDRNHTSGGSDRDKTVMGGMGTEQWRQWKYWCFSCGVNLRHNSAGHTHEASKKRTHIASATFENQQGGNNLRDHLWKKWCHPVTHKPHDKKE